MAGESYLPEPAQWAAMIFLLFLGGIFSGLSLGLMQMDPTRLKIVKKAGSKTERKHADTIYPIRKRGNYLLCCLLVGNVLTNNTIAILLEQLTNGVVAIIGSTASIVVFGEIIPQSICGRHPLATGYYTIWITRFFYVVLFPVAYPVSLLLDSLLGTEIGVFYQRKELLSLIQETQEHNKLKRDEIGILSGALNLEDTCVEELMTPIDQVFMLDADSLLTRAKIREVSEALYSRIPVFSGSRENIVGMILVHDVLEAATRILEVSDPANTGSRSVSMRENAQIPGFEEGGGAGVGGGGDGTFTGRTLRADSELGAVTVRSCMYQFSSLPRFLNHTNLRSALSHFKSGDSHLAVVFNNEQGLVTGIFTMASLVEHVFSSRHPDEKEYRRAHVVRYGPAYKSTPQADLQQGKRPPMPASLARSTAAASFSVAPVPARQLAAPATPGRGGGASNDPTEPLLPRSQLDR